MRAAVQKHNLIAFRRVAAQLYKKNLKWRKAVNMATKDALFIDAMETAAQSASRELVAELLQARSCLCLSLLFNACWSTDGCAVRQPRARRQASAGADCVFLSHIALLIALDPFCVNLRVLAGVQMAAQRARRELGAALLRARLCVFRSCGVAAVSVACSLD